MAFDRLLSSAEYGVWNLLSLFSIECKDVETQMDKRSLLCHCFSVPFPFLLAFLIIEMRERESFERCEI